MSFEDEANDLKNKFNGLMKLYKKHEKKKKEKNQIDPDFYKRDADLKTKISMFFQEYGKHIKPRKNSLGTFCTEDYVASRKLSNLKKENSNSFFLPSFSSDLNINKQEFNTTNRQFSNNNLQSTKTNLEKKSFTVREVFENKNLVSPTERSTFNGHLPKYQGSLHQSHDLMDKISSPTMHIGNPYINRSPGLTFRMNNNTSGFINNRMYTDKNTKNYRYHQNMSYKHMSSFSNPNFSSKSPSISSSTKSPSFEGKSSSFNMVGGKSTAFVSRGNKPHINFSPDLNVQNLGKPPYSMHSSYNAMKSKKSSYFNPSHYQQNRNPKTTTFSPNFMYNNHIRHNPGPYMRQSMPYINRQYQTMSSNKGPMISPNNFNNNYRKMDTPTFYDKYVQNQISINDIIKTKKPKIPEAKPIILNTCTVSKKKVDPVLHITEPVEKVTLTDLTDKVISKKSQDLLYEICDNFVEHVIVSAGNLIKQKKNFDKEDLKFILKMEFGIDPSDM